MILLLLVSLYGMLTIKIYILMAFLPSAILWIFFSKYNQIRSSMVRLMMLPVIIVVAVASGYFATVKASAENPKYALDAIAKTAQVTAYDIRYWTGRHAGSGYSLGELDGSIESMLRLAPQAINVTLFRPYLWEVNNPLMLLSAIESFIVTLLVLYLIIGKRLAFVKTLIQADILFALTFSIIFGFAVGVSTFNFGTLVRYKIPMMPFFVIALILILDHLKSPRKLT